MPRKVSFTTLREVHVNIEDTVSEAGEARPPPDACKPGGTTRASSSLVYQVNDAVAGIDDTIESSLALPSLPF